MTFTVTFHPSGRGQAQGKADPKHPDGVNPDMSNGASKTCIIDLPYPAPECGHFIAVCDTCGLRVGITAAGRADDPRTAKVKCKGN